MFDLNIQSLSVVALKGKLSRMNNKINQFHCMKWVFKKYYISYYY